VKLDDFEVRSLGTDFANEMENQVLRSNELLKSPFNIDFDWGGLRR
jgi:hypothetical protein